MFSNQRIALSTILAILAIVGADIRTGKAQSPRLKLYKDRAAFALRALPDWFKTDLLRTETAAIEFAGKSERSLRKEIADDWARLAGERHPAIPRQTLSFQQKIVIEQEVRIVHSFFEDARPQILAELQKVGSLSESDVAEVFRRNVIATAAKSPQPQAELDLSSGKVTFSRPIYLLGGVGGGIAIGKEIDLPRLAKTAAHYYRACRQGMNDEMAKSPPSNSQAGISELVAKCVDSTLAKVRTDIDEVVNEPATGTAGYAPENVD